MDNKTLAALVRATAVSDADRDRVTAHVASTSSAEMKESTFNLTMTLLFRLSLWDLMKRFVAEHPRLLGVGNNVQLISMHVSAGQYDEALALLETVKGTKEHHFRFYAPILTSYCKFAPTKALELYRQVRAHSLLPTEQAYIELLGTTTTAAEKESILVDMAIVLEAVSSPSFGVPTTVSATGECSRCNSRLAVLDIGEGEKKEIVATLCSGITIPTIGDYNIVIDGANVGFFDNKGKTEEADLSKIDRIIQLLPAGSKPLVVLHKRHLKKNPRKAWNQMFLTPYGENDDLYWLYFTIAKDCPIVSNDEMKDHAFSALRQSEFKRWKSCHVIHYDLEKLHMPAAYTRCIQKAAGAWHFPHGDGWLCGKE
jgi:hypothetical protein